MARASKIPPKRLDMALAEGLPTPVAGVDEAGRGPWAGPLVAAAVMLAEGAAPEGLDDSKRIAPRRRETLAAALEALAAEGGAAIGIAVVEAAEIDRIGLGPANDAALCRAVAALGDGPLGLPAGLVIDGRRLPPALNLPARAITGGDGLVSAIAAASILAKVTRDRMMDALDARHPGYGWSTNRGYGTAGHSEALARLGPCPQHRRSFRPVARVAEERALGRAQI
ncbi:MAG: ribonuclease HII [Pseudomonadota bacterium]